MMMSLITNTGRRDGECVSSKIAQLARLVAEIEEAVRGLVVRHHAAQSRPTLPPHRNGTLKTVTTP